MRSKYIFVTGGVLSGLGKGIVTVSIGKLLQSKGFTVGPLKIDPYLNIDAGTMNPYEHGEVFVLDDGSEVDMDLGNYERFLDKILTSKNNLTTGKIYKKVIDKERKGEYLGKTVQIIPHIVDGIQEWVKDVGEHKTDFVIIEVGGTVGDIENVPFLEAARQLALKEDVYFAHVSLVPMLKAVGEFKTKPTQHSVQKLREIGIQPNMIICRTEKPLDGKTKEKVSLFCGVKPENVISDHDTITYEVPLLLKEQEVDKKILERFGLGNGAFDLKEWTNFVQKLKNPGKEITIALTGKYTGLQDSYISIREALTHAATSLNCRINYRWIETTEIEEGKVDVKTALEGVNGVLVPGGFGSRGAEGKMKCIQFARENNIPFLGLCLGFQLATTEFARNVCGLKNANSTEIEPKTPHAVIDLLPEQRKVYAKGGTMRLGGQEVMIRPESFAHKLYGKTNVRERFRHRYECNPKYISILEKNGLVFSGKAPEQPIMQILELQRHPFFVATQFHPEFTSKPLKPNPLFSGFVKAALIRFS